MNTIDTIDTIDSTTLRDWLESGKKVNILDIRPIHEREEWFIPNSIHANAYSKLKANDHDAMKGVYLDKSIPVVTFCAGGKTSLIASQLLTEDGYEAYSLEGGMKGWSLAWNIARLPFSSFEIVQFRRTGKGCLSYMIISNGETMVIDASLPLEVYQNFAKKENLILKYTADTHIHADHLSRTREVANANNLLPHLPENDKVLYPFNPIEEEHSFELGGIKVKAISTPGHTNESTCYLVNDEVLLSGDTLFIDGVGRPDLKANNEQALEKSKLLYNSLQKLLKLDKQTIVMPGHTSKPVDFDNKPIQTTMANIFENVSVLKLKESDFTESIMQRIPATPANYLKVVEHNLSGDFANINPVDLEAGANRCAIS